MTIYRDQIGEAVELKGKPLRIVSLVPSQTELLWSLGLTDEVVGITKFCIHPASWYHSKTRVGGTKNVDIEKIRDLQPDLIIGNKEENEQSDIQRLKQIAPVWMSDIYTLDDALNMIRSIGELTGTEGRAGEIIDEIRSSFEKLACSLEHQTKKPKVLYFMWNEPLMVAGKRTFINEMLQRCGLENLVQEERYPLFDKSFGQPELVLLSTEPYPFREKHFGTVQTLFPHAKVMLVDGEPFSWYGSRLMESPVYFIALLEKAGVI